MKIPFEIHHRYTRFMVNENSMYVIQIYKFPTGLYLYALAKRTSHIMKNGPMINIEKGNCTRYFERWNVLFNAAKPCTIGRMKKYSFFVLYNLKNIFCHLHCLINIHTLADANYALIAPCQVKGHLSVLLNTCLYHCRVL